MPGPLRKARSKAASESSGPKRLSVLNRPLTTLGAIVIIIFLGWAFFMGFMVGRGQNPEQRVEALTELFQPGPFLAEPHPQAGPKPGEEESTNQGTGAAGPEESTAPPTDRAQVPRALDSPKGEALQAWEDAPAPAPQNMTPPAAQSASEPQFDFLYQIAAFKKAADAKRLSQKLEAGGLRSHTKKSGKFHLVMVRLRGSQDDADRLHEEMLDMQLGAPLLLSKKSVETKQKTR
jgi:cell division septation protein DedD